MDHVPIGAPDRTRDPRFATDRDGSGRRPEPDTPGARPRARARRLAPLRGRVGYRPQCGRARPAHRGRPTLTACSTSRAQPAANVGIRLDRAADNVGVCNDASGRDAAPDAVAGRFLGYPERLLATAWTLQDICSYLQISERKARPLMKSPGAPSRLRLLSERCDRWNGYQVLAWLHGSPDLTAAGPAHPPPSGADRGSDGGAVWVPAGAAPRPRVHGPTT